MEKEGNEVRKLKMSGTEKTNAKLSLFRALQAYKSLAEPDGTKDIPSGGCAHKSALLKHIRHAETDFGDASELLPPPYRWKKALEEEDEE